jgi:hypothetical protein
MCLSRYFAYLNEGVLPEGMLLECVHLQVLTRELSRLVHVSTIKSYSNTLAKTVRTYGAPTRGS